MRHVPLVAVAAQPVCVAAAAGAGAVTRAVVHLARVCVAGGQWGQAACGAPSPSLPPHLGREHLEGAAGEVLRRSGRGAGRGGATRRRRLSCPCCHCRTLGSPTGGCSTRRPAKSAEAGEAAGGDEVNIVRLHPPPCLPPPSSLTMYAAPPSSTHLTRVGARPCIHCVRLAMGAPGSGRPAYDALPPPAAAAAHAAHSGPSRKRSSGDVARMMSSRGMARTRALRCSGPQDRPGAAWQQQQQQQQQ